MDTSSTAQHIKVCLYVPNQMVFLQDIHYKLFYILIFTIKRVKKAKLWSVEDCR